ncbi:MAG TPA: efflux transporter periplasmic adaptor subunit [Cyanobacteria bacterium UBA11162]|nr:efflux transporter periplasmic adaptor subunit [Cyanobacteria bacterium UBA11162]
MTQTAPNREKAQLKGATLPESQLAQDAVLLSIPKTDHSIAPDVDTPEGATEIVALETIPRYQNPKRAKTPLNWLSGGRGLFLGMGIGIAVALGATRFLTPQSTNSPATTATAISASPTQTVTIAEVKTQGVNRTLAVTGSVNAFEMIPVMSQATGLQIQDVLVEEGAFVKAGQLMARLNDSILQAQLTQAKAAVTQAEARLAELRAGSRQEEIARARETVRSAEAAVTQAQSDLELAQVRVNRNKMLQSEGAIARDRLDEILNQERSSRSTLEQAQARLREAQQQLAQLEAGPRQEVITQAEAQLVQAQGQLQSIIAQLKDTRVLAPVSGKVAERNARVGDISSPSQTLFKIIENGRLELIAEVPETQLPEIQPGQNVQITSNSDSNLRLSGKVREIDPMVDEKTRIAKVKIDLPVTASLKPGMFLKASIITSTPKGLTVPLKAVLTQGDRTAIAYVLEADNTVKAQQVETGELLSGEQVEIKSGLSVGDRVIVKGAAYLKDGDKVEVITKS